MGIREADREPATTGRAEIIAVARRLFMARGYRAVSTRDIAAAVGLTQPALYHHFGGKEALYVTVLEDELASRAVEMWEAAHASASATSRLASMAARIAERSEDDLAQMFHDLRFEISAESRQRIGMAFHEAMLMPLLAVVDGLVEEGAIETMEQSGLSRQEAAMYILSVIRMLTDVERDAARAPSRTPSEIGALTARLVTSGLRSLPPGS